MKTTCSVLFLFLVCGVANAQVVPEATGPGVAQEPAVPTGSYLQYALRYTELARFGTSIPSQQSASASGSLNYVSASERRPFTFEYGGGYTWAISGPAYGTGQSQRVFLSQGLNGRKWNFLVSDDASYLPQTPNTGFLGIPGIGEPIGVANPSPTSSQTILSLNTQAVENVANGSLEASLSNATSLTGGASSRLLRYPNGDGYDTDTLSATGVLARVLNSRDSLSGAYEFFNFSYPGYDVSFVTNSALIGIQHKWTRNLVTNVAAGPQFISSSVPTVVPSSINVAVNASLTYLLRFTTATASYTRGTNGGSGYLFGAEVDDAVVDVSHQYGLNWTIGLTGGFQRTAGLNNNGVTDAVFGAAEGTWRIARNMIVFANYTADDQWSTSTLPTNSLNLLLNTIGFGIGYSPLPRRVRQ